MRFGQHTFPGSHAARRPLITTGIALTVVMLATAARAMAGAGPAIPDEFRIRRERVFEFAQKPTITRTGNLVTIRFASKGYCDATVAIENEEGRIVRHLVSGVLGANAPAPFQKNSKAQTVVWDGKDDQGVYLDDKDALTVRVSLGLKPRFERTLLWSPHKGIGPFTPILCASPEGVYVGEGYAVDHLRLFDRKGDYVRTVYPFPAGKIGEVVGLRMHTFAHDGVTRPLMRGYHQATLLTCGTNNNPRSSGEGFGPSAIAAHGRRLALVHLKLNRLASDGSSGGLKFEGPKTGFHAKRWRPIHGRWYEDSGPRSAAFSPDGKWLYLTGYKWRSGQRYNFDWLPAVRKMEYAADAEPRLFAGSMKQYDVGTDNTKFKFPTSVACDAKGRVYVSDYMNNRIQVFTPDGKHFKSIAVHRPAHVDVHRRTGEIYVFSWLLVTRYIGMERIRPTFTRLGPVENPRVITRCPLPLVGHAETRSWNNSGGLPFRMALDSWADPPVIWLVPGAARWISSGNGTILENWRTTGIRLLVERNGRLAVQRSFGNDVTQTVVRTKPPILWRQRLYVNPRNGMLYVAEGDSGVMKSCNQLIEIDPTTGRVRLVTLPMGTEDLCFDLNGRCYLRTDRIVARYDSQTWREIPWDYGEQHASVSFGMRARATSLIAGLPTPGHRSNPFWHMGGMAVSATGHLVVSTCNLRGTKIRTATGGPKRGFKYEASNYTPKLYPGRVRWGEVHVWDKHGKPVYKDAVRGMAHMNGIGIDRDDNIYMMIAARRLLNGKVYDPKLARDISCTLVKVQAKKARVLSTSGRAPVPLPAAARPKRPVDFSSRWTGGAWVENAEWFYGGVGFNPRGCICWNSRFDLDLFARSFAPEPLRFSVAVLDSNGNLITRIGKYGNVDDGHPSLRSAKPWQNAQRRSAGSLQGGPPNPRSIGGDEVALAYACYVATHTDRRLFIADAGNARIASVKLDYHVTERIRLADVPGRPGR